jgi:diguanylate cyclase (GGDEF)-like protein/PAS domain S-box-containing protein
MIYRYDLKTRQFMFVNDTFREFFGGDSENGREVTTRSVFISVYPKDRNKVRKVKDESLEPGKAGGEVEYRMMRPDGSLHWMHDRWIVIKDEEGSPAFIEGIVRDNTSRKRMEDKLIEMSLKDQMTGLYNRRGFIALAEQQIITANNTKRSMLLTFVDCDGLKWVNDTLGHKEGDNLIIDTANVLRRTFRESDIIARLGGDEFAVLSEDIADMNPEDFSERLQRNIDSHNAKKIRPYTMSISWGTVVYNPRHPVSLDNLMSAADERMYAHKNSKPGRKNRTV